MSGPGRIWYALVDANNFYASCERVFNPALCKIPVVVLSNNDGCIIARSNEAKALGIGMGAPLHEVRHIIGRHRVRVYSSNYQLYGDMSARLMNTLQHHCPDIEIYSIDEAFLKFRCSCLDTLLQNKVKLRQLIGRGLGIPVSIGIGPTKTLAKLANHIAKKRANNGVYLLEANAPVLQDIPIEKIWGVAKGYRRRLSAIGVKTVTELAAVPEGWMRQEFGVVGVRLLKELQGFPCYNLEPPVSVRKNMMVSRSFRKDVYDLKEICEALAVYVTRLGEKLRSYDQATAQITVFLKANPFKQVRSDGLHYFARTVELPEATNNTADLIRWACRIGTVLFERGTNYKKAGILASRLCPADTVQGNLFLPGENRQKAKALMQACDAINSRMGRHTVYFAGCGRMTKQSWSRKEEWVSPRYTTRWNELLTVRI